MDMNRRNSNEKRIFVLVTVIKSHRNDCVSGREQKEEKTQLKN